VYHYLCFLVANMYQKHVKAPHLGVLVNSSEHAFVKNFVNDWANLGTLIKRHLGQPGHSRCLEMSEN
jgi:hypothetical protein